VLQKIELVDGASIVPVIPKHKLLCFGDSITHGYDTRHPSCWHAACLADFLDAQEYNKAIGGDKYFPELAKTRENFVPDYILVAYGTNDWSCHPRDFAEDCCREFYKNICANYPDSKVFALTPIWRADLDMKTGFGSFFDVEKVIREAVKDLKNVTVISGFDLVPHDAELYADLRLHPNDEGFAHYFNNLSSQIKQYI
jgi:lysophospholipase L1-like esterase